MRFFISSLFVIFKRQFYKYTMYLQIFTLTFIILKNKINNFKTKKKYTFLKMIKKYMILIYMYDIKTENTRNQSSIIYYCFEQRQKPCRRMEWMLWTPTCRPLNQESWTPKQRWSWRDSFWNWKRRNRNSREWSMWPSQQPYQTSKGSKFHTSTWSANFIVHVNVIHVSQKNYGWIISWCTVYELKIWVVRINLGIFIFSSSTEKAKMDKASLTFSRLRKPVGNTKPKVIIVLFVCINLFFILISRMWE